MPDVKYSAIMPTPATTIATGNSRANGFAGLGLGRSGGPATSTSPTSMWGVGSRVARTKSIRVLDVLGCDSVPAQRRRLWCVDDLRGSVTVANASDNSGGR